jgi:arginyl-tRNA synthetase
MIAVKQELLAGLAAELENRLPGAGARASFETPKSAAHGDLATNAAMQSAKPLKLNPRQLAESLKTALMAQASYQRWVEAIDIAGPGFINFRLKPAARQQVVREVLEAAGQYGAKPTEGQKMLVEFVSANPTGPLHVGHGRKRPWAMRSATCLRRQGWQVAREFYYNDAGVQIHTLAVSVQARARPAAWRARSWPEVAYNGDYIADIATDFMAARRWHS